MVAAWLEVIDKRTVPTDRLNDAYVAAIRSRALPGMLTPMELVAAWRVIAEREAVERRDARDRDRLKLLDGPRPLTPMEVAQAISEAKAGMSARVLGFTSAANAAAVVLEAALVDEAED